MNIRPDLRLIAVILAALLALFLVWQGWRLLTASDRAKAELGENTTEAAQASGSDAVNAAGDSQAREGQIKRKVDDAKAKIDAAADGAAIDAAGRDGLCDASPDLCAEK